MHQNSRHRGGRQKIVIPEQVGCASRTNLNATEGDFITA
jgi:hypothetical protein